MTDSDGIASEVQEATLQPLLLHSLSELREIWRPVIEAAQVRSATEIGSESGVTSQLLIDHLHQNGGGQLTIVDPGARDVPAPPDVQREIVRGYSPEALDGLAPSDLYLIDGDHNYWTVSNELAAIAKAAEGRELFPLLLLNDVSWPAARRDQYYSPQRLPPEAVHPHSFELGAVPGEPQLQRSGFRGEGGFAYAMTEGGPRNGVLTALEDFVAARPELEVHLVAPVFGLGVVFDRQAPYAERIRELLAPYAGSPFLARLERNRVQLFVRLIEQQDEHTEGLQRAARARRTDTVRYDLALGAAAARELTLRDEQGALERELAATRAELERVTAELAAAAQAPPQAGLRQLLSRLRGLRG